MVFIKVPYRVFVKDSLISPSRYTSILSGPYDTRLGAYSLRVPGGTKSDILNVLTVQTILTDDSYDVYYSHPVYWENSRYIDSVEDSNTIDRDYKVFIAFDRSFLSQLTKKDPSVLDKLTGNTKVNYDRPLPILYTTVNVMQLIRAFTIELNVLVKTYLENGYERINEHLTSLMRRLPLVFDVPIDPSLVKDKYLIDPSEIPRRIPYGVDVSRFDLHPILLRYEPWTLSDFERYVEGTERLHSQEMPHHPKNYNSTYSFYDDDTEDWYPEDVFHIVQRREEFRAELERSQQITANEVREFRQDRQYDAQMIQRALPLVEQTTSERRYRIGRVLEFIR